MRYSGQMAAALWTMEAEDSALVLLGARRREAEEKLFFRWCILDALGMGKSFEEFKKELTRYPAKSAKEIIKEVTEDYDRAFGHGYSKVEIDGTI